jgi:Dinucleotide-utilizing enzymes involved in molybdopterin and thiamine biosynthesis family 1
MLDAFSRTGLILGPEGMAALAGSKVAVIGLGGVGSWAAEALARSGLGRLVLVDDDSVCLTNINRQVIATRGTVGRPKVEAMRERILDINPQAEVETHEEYFGPDSAERLLEPGLDYIVDAIDTVSAKIVLILRAKSLGTPIVSAMGTGNKLDPTRLELADIYETSVCPLARVMRRELRRRGVDSLQVIYSREEPIKVPAAENPCALGCICPKKDRTCVGRRSVPGSVAFVPPAAGLIAASVVVRGIVSRRGILVRPDAASSRGRETDRDIALSED